MKFTGFALCFLLLIGNMKEANCQNVIEAFFGLSGPEKCWTIRHPFTARKALSVTREARIATGEILVAGLLDTFPAGGKVDAFRHCYWMARLTQSIGERKARSLGIAHEKGNYKSFLKGKTEDAVLPDSVSGQMDLQNNETGIQIGLSNWSIDRSKVESDVVSAIFAGKAVILKRNHDGRLVNCEGIVITEKKQWALPYCLVRSDN